MKATNDVETLRPKLQRLQRLGWTAGAAGLVLCGVGAWAEREQFFRSYLAAHLFWLGIAAGSAAVVMLHHLTGGEWGWVIRRVLEASAMTLPLLALLFLPLILALPVLYPWARPAEVARSSLLQHKSPYLNVPFFLIRTGFYFAAWSAMAVWLRARSREQDRAASPHPLGRVRLLSALGLIVYGLTATFAAVDWAMSLEPEWFSTIYGMMFGTGQVLGAFALGILVSGLLSPFPPMSAAATPSRLNDLGSLLLTFVLLWAYVAFSQYLIVWSGNLPEEVVWYLRRAAGGWAWVVLGLLLVHFFLPFAVLLSRRAKRNARVLSSVAAIVLLMRLVDTYWMVMPAFYPDGLRLHWLDLAATLGIGGVWAAAFAAFLRDRPLVPTYDPADC